MKKKRQEEEEGRKANLNGALSWDLMSRAAFHRAPHAFGSHCRRRSGGRREDAGGGGRPLSRKELL